MWLGANFESYSYGGQGAFIYQVEVKVDITNQRVGVGFQYQRGEATERGPKILSKAIDIGKFQQENTDAVQTGGFFELPAFVARTLGQALVLASSGVYPEAMVRSPFHFEVNEKYHRSRTQ